MNVQLSWFEFTWVLDWDLITTQTFLTMFLPQYNTKYVIYIFQIRGQWHVVTLYWFLTRCTLGHNDGGIVEFIILYCLHVDLLGVDLWNVIKTHILQLDNYLPLFNKYLWDIKSLGFDYRFYEKNDHVWQVRLWLVQKRIQRFLQ